MSYFGDNLKRIRKAKKVTQEELAGVVGVNKKYRPFKFRDDK